MSYLRPDNLILSIVSDPTTGHRDEAEPRSNHVLEELGVLRPLSRDGRPQVTVRARRNPALVSHAGDSVVEAGLQGKPRDRRNNRINAAESVPTTFPPSMKKRTEVWVRQEDAQGRSEGNSRLNGTLYTVREGR